MKIMKLLKISLFTIFSLITTMSYAQPGEAAIISGKSVIIQSAMKYGIEPKGYFDLPGLDQPKAGKNLEVYSLDNGPDRSFTFRSTGKKGYYNILPANAMFFALDVENGANTNGTNIRLMEKKGTKAQEFILKYLGEGKYKIYSSNGKVVCTSNRSAENGTNVHLWDDHDGAWTEWYIFDAKTKALVTPIRTEKITSEELLLKGETQFNKSSAVLIQSGVKHGVDKRKGYFDLPGISEIKQGKNIELYDLDNGTDRKFIIAPTEKEGYFNIKSYKNPSLVVDVENGGTDNGTNIRLWSSNGAPAQQFVFKYLGGGKYKIYAANGKILTTANRSAENGANVQLWDDHDGAWTEWYICDIYGKPMMPVKKKDPAEFNKKLDKLENQLNSIEF